MEPQLNSTGRVRRRLAQRLFHGVAGREPGTAQAMAPQPTVSKPVGPSEVSNQPQAPASITARPVGLPPEELPQVQEPKPRAFSGLVGMPVEESTPTQPQPQQPQPIQFKTTEEMLEDFEAEKHAKRMEQQRTRRNRVRQQKQEIKKALKVPHREVVAAAEEKRKYERANYGMNQGRTMKGAPSGNQLITGEYNSAKIELVSSFENANVHGIRRNRKHGAGPESYNEDDREFNITRRGFAGAFGTSAGPDQSKSTEPLTTDDAESEWESAAEEVTWTYVVDSDYIICRCDAILKKDELEKHGKSGVHADYPVEKQTEGETYSPASVCRLCQEIIAPAGHAVEHMMTRHSDESNPEHDARFGDVLGPAVRRLIHTKKKRMRDWERQGQENAAKIRASSKTRTRASVEEAEGEGMVQRGHWIQIKGGKWVQDWIPRQASG